MRTLLLVGSSLLTLLTAGTVASATTVTYTSSGAFASATTGPTTIGFNGILVSPATSAAFSSLTVGAVSFSNGDPAVDVNVTAKDYYEPLFGYPADFLVNASTTDSTNTLNVTLATPTYAIAIDFGALFIGSGPALVTLNDGTTFVEAFPPVQGNTEFVGFVSSDPITSLALTVSDPLSRGYVTSSYVLEDLTLATPVPEPTSMALFGTGVVGLFAWRRRRRPDGTRANNRYGSI